MATGRQCLRAKAHNLPRGHNGRQHKCYDIFVFFGFKGKHSHSPSQQVSQNIFAIRVARVIFRKNKSTFLQHLPTFRKNIPSFFSNSPLTAHAPTRRRFPPSKVHPPLARTYAYTPTSPSFALFAFTLHPLSQATIYQELTTQKEGEHKVQKAFTPSAPNDKWCVGS